MPHKPNPWNSDDPTIVRWLMISVAVYIALVLNLFEPYAIKIHRFIFIYHVMLSTYGLVSLLTVWAAMRWLKPALKQWHPTGGAGTVLAWVLVLVVLVSLSSWLYSVFLHHTISGWHNMYVPLHRFVDLMPQFLSMYLVWGLMVWASVSLYYRGQTQHQNNAETEREPLVTLSENQADRFRINPKQIICLKTCDNYLEVYYLDEAQSLQKRLVRSSMSKAQKSLERPRFFRPHQSFLVNIEYVRGLDQGTQGNGIEVAYLDFPVAVSRKNLKALKALLTQSP